MSIHLTCPECGAIYEDLEDTVLGTEVQCHCSHVFIAAPPQPLGLPNVVRVSPRKEPAKQEPAKKPQFQPASSAAASVVGAASGGTQKPLRPLQSKPRRRSGVKLVLLLAFVVLGGATAFGVLNALGFIDPDKPVLPGSTVAQTDTSDDPDNDSSNNTTFGVTSQSANSGDNRNDGSRTDATERTDAAGTTGDGPLIPSVEQNPGNPLNDNGSQLAAAGKGYRLLEVEPFNGTDELTAALHETVQTEIQKQRAAIQSLIAALDQLVVALATDGKISEIQQLQIAKDQLERAGAAGALDGFTDETVIVARESFAAAIADSKERLLAAYDAAIDTADAAGDKLLRTSLSQERDAGFDLANDAWIVVFRSSDPHRWGTSSSNGDEFSLNLASLPDSIQSLRLRRVDTGAAVVMPMTKALLTSDYTDENGNIGWVGSSNGRRARKLGIFRTDHELDSSPGNTVILSGRFGRRYEGWGFGLVQNRSDLPQGYSWNGLPLGPTVFEVSVSDQPIENTTPFSLRVDTQLGTPSGPVDLPTDDPVLVELDAAKAAHSDAIEGSRERVLAAFDEQLRELGAAADAAGIEKLAVTRKEFADGDAVTDPPSKIGSKLSTFYGEIDRADEALSKAYGKAIASFERSEREDVAKVLKEQVEVGVGYEADRWMVLFRSPDPSIWNTHARGQFRFARPITDASENTQYLRMRVVPVRSSSRSKTPPPVICQMRRERLAIQSDVEGIGWNGLSRKDRNAYHLGIYRLDKMIKFPIPREFKGFVSIWSKGFDAHLGWGFGHVLHFDRDQGYSWSGLTSTVPLQIEIAVTAKPLRENEAKVLLSGAAPTQ